MVVGVVVDDGLIVVDDVVVDNGLVVVVGVVVLEVEAVDVVVMREVI